MRPIEDSCLTPEERRAEIASILAVGILRFCAAQHQANVGCADASAILADSAVSCLEVPAETVLSVHNGYRFPRTRINERRRYLIVGKEVALLRLHRVQRINSRFSTSAWTSPQN